MIDMAVTYLSDIGGPTMVLTKAAPLRHGERLEGEIGECFVSRPRVGKHISFDGRLLHAAPAELRPLWRGRGTTSTTTKGRKRVSFLVNVWLNHKPRYAEPLDDSMVHQMITPPLPLPFTPAEEDFAIPTIKTALLTEPHRFRFTAEGGKYWVDVPTPPRGSLDANKGSGCVIFNYAKGGSNNSARISRGGVVVTQQKYFDSESEEEEEEEDDDGDVDA